MSSQQSVVYEGRIQMMVWSSTMLPSSKISYTRGDFPELANQNNVVSM